MQFWKLSHRFDPIGCALADRHYSRQKPGSPQYMPPGSCRCLVAPNGKAVIGFSMPLPQYVKHAWAGALMVSIFRNENAGGLASDMIREALAWVRTQYTIGAQGCVTFVDPTKVPGIPEHGELVKGFCFHKAGFKVVGETKKGLLAWQLSPAAIAAL